MEGQIPASLAPAAVPAGWRPSMRQYELVETVRAYDPTCDEDRLNRAYVYAMKAHGSQTRASGDPYFSHPLEVAGILTRYRLDSGTIITALLHDVIEDTDASAEEIERLFGADILRLVDGVTKLTRMELKSEDTRQAENFRKLLLAMSEDIRVLLVKLADRLHNMRTLHFIKKPEKRRRIAAETLEIYAPLAERIGMSEIKGELEDLAFAQVNPEGRESIHTRLAFLREHGGNLVRRIQHQLRQTLADHDITQVDISGREKSPFSIWTKMQRKNVVFEQLSDIMAFRVIVPDVMTCYHTLGVIHSTYPMVPGRFKDYISTPKSNGYQSLHTGVLGPDGHRIEIQIRTSGMHEVAEKGVAAHWQYKQGDHVMDGRQYGWVRDLLDILDQASNPDEFLEHTKMAMYQDQVFCFTPKGDLINLPAGSTPVDFAYAVHTEVGDRCVGVKINGSMAPLRTILNNGDQVEVRTSDSGRPNPGWERFVVTGKARSRIRRYIRTQQREQYQDLGRLLLEREFRGTGLKAQPGTLEPVLKQFRVPDGEDLMVAVGQGNVAAREVLLALRPPVADPDPATPPLPPTRGSKPEAVPITGMIPGMAMHMAGCCHPLPGDRIVGIVTTGRGVTIHTIDCDNLVQYQEQPERWLDVAWGTSEDGEARSVGRLHVVLTNEPGSLSTLTSVIARNGGNITNLKIVSRSPDFFDLLVDIEVRDVRHLTNNIAALRAQPEIHTVDRARH